MICQNSSTKKVLGESQIHLEQMILAIFIMNPIMLNQYIVNDNWFELGIHKIIYNALKQSIVDKHLDMYKVQELLEKANFDYFNKIMDSYVSSALLDKHLSELEENYKIRQTAIIMEQLSLHQIEYPTFLENIRQIEEQTQYIDTLVEPSPNDIFDEITLSNQSLIFNRLSNLNLLKLEKNTLNVIAARPSVGKSGLALNIFNDLASTNEYDCVYINMEMPDRDIYRRLVSMNTKIPMWHLEGLEKCSKAGALVMDCLLSFKDKDMKVISHPMDINSIGTVIRNEQKKGKHVIVFIDYLGYIKSAKESNDRERLGKICRDLQIMTKEYDCTIFLLAQINREGADNPTMNNLKDTGELEQSAHSVLLLSEIGNYDVNNDVQFIKLVTGKNRESIKNGKMIMKYHKKIQCFEVSTEEEAKKCAKEVKYEG